MKNKILQFTIAALALFSVVMLTACPKENAIRNAAKASYRLPGITVDLANDIKTGHDRGLISADLTRQFGTGIERLGQLEQSLVVAVKAADALDRSGQPVPAADMANIRATVDAIITATADTIRIFNLLSPDAQHLLDAAIAALRIVLTTIGNGFGSTLLHLIASAPNGPARVLAA